ncbi:MAG: AsmA family protein [Acidiferrobacterales bacterium]
MKKVIKILAIVLGIVILGVVALAIALPFLIDPNDYKDQVIQRVKENTGRDLKIEGNIGLSFFPWLGVEMGGVELSNAPGFGEAPFARIDSAGVKVKVLPLLSRKVEVDRVKLDGLKLDLAKNQAGKTNWDDLMGPTQPGSVAHQQPSTSAGLGIAALTVGGIDIRNSEARWRDESTRSEYAVRDVALQSGEIAPGKPVDIEIAFELEAGDPPKRIPVKLKTEANLDLGQQTLDLAELTLSVDNMDMQGRIQATKITDAPVIQGSLGIAPFDPGPLMKKLAIEVDPTLINALADVSAKTEFKADLGHQTVDVPSLSLTAADLALTGKLKVRQLDTKPQVNGQLAVPKLDLRKLMKKFDVDYKAVDKKVLANASFKSSFNASADHVAFEKLNAKLDESTLSGKLAVRNFSKPAYAFNLTLDQIDLDRYLPPASPQQKGASGKQDVVATLPLDVLRDLNVRGQARINKLKAFGIRSSNVSIKLGAKNGLLTVGPNQAALYGGRYSGKTVVDARSKTPKFTVNEKLTNVQLGPFLRDAEVYDKLTGTGNVDMNLTARGSNTQRVMQTLNGKGVINLRNGEILGVNLQQSINDAKTKYDKLRGKPVKVRPKATDSTVFTRFSGTVNFTNGVARNNDLTMQGANLRASGKGTANLPKETIHYRLEVTLAEAASRKGATVPVDIRGTFSAPEFNVAWNEVLKAEIEKKVKKKIEKKKEEKKKELEDELRKKLEDKLKEKLKF